MHCPYEVRRSPAADAGFAAAPILPGLTDTEERAAIRAAGPPDPDSDVETCARFGLSTLLPLAGKAYVERQPLLLDF